VDVKPQPARFPLELPGFFIKFLTDVGDTVLDIFAGSNTTGAAAEHLGRHWIAFENNRMYLATSSFRFLDSANVEKAQNLFQNLLSSDEQHIGSEQQPRLVQ